MYVYFQSHKLVWDGICSNKDHSAPEPKQGVQILYAIDVDVALEMRSDNSDAVSLSLVEKGPSA